MLVGDISHCQKPQLKKSLNSSSHFFTMWDGFSNLKMKYIKTIGDLFYINEYTNSENCTQSFLWRFELTYFWATMFQSSRPAYHLVGRFNFSLFLELFHRNVSFISVSIIGYNLTGKNLYIILYNTKMFLSLKILFHKDSHYPIPVSFTDLTAIKRGKNQYITVDTFLFKCLFKADVLKQMFGRCNNQLN